MNYTERNKLLDKLSLIGLMAIFVELFFYAVDHCYTKRLDIMPGMPLAMNIFGVIYLIVSVILFVRTYKDGKKNLKIYAIEFLALAILCPIITYWYYPKYFGLSVSFLHKINHNALLIAVLVYYIIRCAYTIAYAVLNSNDRKIKKKKKAKA